MLVMIRVNSDLERKVWMIVNYYYDFNTKWEFL